MGALPRFRFSCRQFARKQTDPERIADQPRKAGLKTRSVLGGHASSSEAGRTGRRTNSPPQLGHVSFMAATQSAQNVHSKVQIRASRLAGGKSMSQRSQPGRSCSIAPACH